MRPQPACAGPASSHRPAPSGTHHLHTESAALARRHRRLRSGGGVPGGRGVSIMRGKAISSSCCLLCPSAAASTAGSNAQQRALTSLSKAASALPAQAPLRVTMFGSGSYSRHRTATILLSSDALLGIAMFLVASTAFIAPSGSIACHNWRRRNARISRTASWCAAAASGSLLKHKQVLRVDQGWVKLFSRRAYRPFHCRNDDQSTLSWLAAIGKCIA